jgi:hypothetical protein
MSSNQDKSKIIERFLKAQADLVLQSADLSVGSIAEMVKDGAIDVAPAFQRRERWQSDKQSALIESFLLNVPVPPIYLAEEEYGSYSVVDGKQRIIAMNKFINEGMRLTRLERFTELEGITFDELPREMSNALRIRPYLRVITLLKQSSSTLKYEVFTRLNKAGVPMLPQEIRNVAFRGALNDLMTNLAKNDFLKKQLKIQSPLSLAFTRMTDTEFVLRFFTVRDRWETFSGVMQTEMDHFMLRNLEAPLAKLKSFETSFNLAIEACERIWGDDAFKRPEGSTTRNQMLQGVYDVQMVGVSLFEDRITEVFRKKNQIRDAFRQEVASNAEFAETMKQFTSNPKRLGYRIGRMRELISSVL